MTFSLRCFATVLLVSLVGLMIHGADASAIMEKHRQALAGDAQKLSAVSSLRYVGKVEKYGLSGDAGVYAQIVETDRQVPGDLIDRYASGTKQTDRFAWSLQFPRLAERMVCRGRNAESLGANGWRRELDDVEAADVHALRFVLGYYYLKGPTATVVREEEGGTRLRLEAQGFPPVEIVVDGQTSLLKSFSFRSFDGSPRTFLVDEYTVSSGIKFPSVLREQGPNPATLRFSVIQVGSTLEGGLFNIPDESSNMKVLNLNQARGPVIPLQVYFGMPLVKGYVGSSPSLNFLVDLGLPFSVIDRSIAGQLGLESEGKFVPVSRYPLGEATMTHVARFLMRDVEFKDQAFLVTDMIPSSVNVQMPIHGILGADFFRNCMLTIDMYNEFIRVETRKDFKAEGKQKKMRFNLRGGQCGVLARVGKVDGEFILSPAVRISVEAAQNSRLGSSLKPMLQNPAAAFTTGLHYGIPSQVGRVDQMMLGDFPIQGVLAELAAFPEESGLASCERGWLGSEVFRHFLLSFDMLEKTLFLAPQEGQSGAEHFNATGLYIVKSGGQMLVQRVVDGSPAQKAGLQVGDALLQIRDFPTDQIVFDRVYTNLFAETDQPIPLKVRRGDSELSLTMEPVKQ